MKVTIVKDYRGQEEIHKTGCRDLKRRNRPYRLADAMTMEATGLEEIYQAYWTCIDDEAVAAGQYPTVRHAWYAWEAEFDVKPCASELEPMADPDEAPKPSRSEAKADLARRMILAVSDVLRSADGSECFRAGMTHEEARQMAANWLSSLPAGRDDHGDGPWWPESLPRPTAKRWVERYS